MTFPSSEAMRLALARVRAGEPAQATRVIQAALMGGLSPESATGDEAGDAGGDAAGQTPQAAALSFGPEPAAPRPSRKSTGAAGPDQGRSQAPVPETGLMKGLRGLVIPRPAPQPGARRADNEAFPRYNHASRNGARAYHLHVPPHARTAPAGLVLMLHGCTQNPVDFSAGTGMNALADRHGLIIAYPEQARGANMQSCWNWFDPKDQQRGSGEPAILAALAHELMERHGIAPARCFVAGLSAGAAMAVILAHTYPDVFAAIGAHSGLAFGAAHDVASAFAAMRGEQGQVRPGPRPAPLSAGALARTIVFHGDADATVHASHAGRIGRDVRDAWGGAQIERIERGAEGGRAYARSTVTDARGDAFLETWRIEGLGHAWSGGRPQGSYTDPAGPDASAQMIRFFLEASGAVEGAKD